MSEQSTVRDLPSTYVGQVITSARVNNFQQNKAPLLSNEMGKPETKAIWYNFTQIEEIYNEMVHQNADGLRIYFGAYSETDLYPHQLCLLMVLTRMNPITLKHEDLILEENNDFQVRWNKSPNGKGPTKDFNYGSPCPPVCGEHEMKYP